MAYKPHLQSASNREDTPRWLRLRLVMGDVRPGVRPNQARMGRGFAFQREECTIAQHVDRPVTSGSPHESGSTMQIEILCTGDEVLTGKIVNTNFSYISQRLEDFGLSVYWGTTVGDDRDALLSAFRLAGERADAVIVNGGLGPTVDDLSQEVAAEAANVHLVLNEEWLARMEEV